MLSLPLLIIGTGGLSTHLLPLGCRVVCWHLGQCLLSHPFCSVDCYVVCRRLILHLSSHLCLSWHRPSCARAPPCLHLSLRPSSSSASASCYASTPHCPSPLVGCHVVVHRHLSLRGSYGHHLSFPLVADCYVINATLLPLDGDRRMLRWLAL